MGTCCKDSSRRRAVTTISSMAASDEFPEEFGIALLETARLREASPLWARPGESPASLPSAATLLPPPPFDNGGYDAGDESAPPSRPRETRLFFPLRAVVAVAGRRRVLGSCTA